MSRGALPPGAIQGRPEVAALVQAEVESVHLVAGGAHKRDENGTNVTAFARHKHSHCFPQYV